MSNEILRDFFNEKAAEWDEKRSEKDALKLEKMAGRLNLKPGSVVLDVGTGTGVFLPYILARIGDKGQVFALDFAENMLKQAGLKNGSGNIYYIQADIMRVPLEDALFDTVICYSSFPHFRDKAKALKEIRRVMKPGGKLAICHTSSRTHINNIHSHNPAVRNDILPDGNEMSLLLSSAGFGNIRIEDLSDSYLAMAEK
jgi:ubiquinone/menaquinone biosynthesis C-methylase UbiE